VTTAAAKRNLPLPSDAIDTDAWSRAHDDLVWFLRDLIRIPSINPPDPPGAELDAARYIAATLEDAGLEPEVLEPTPGRGSVVARLRGDGTAGEPLLLLSHLDVVPAPGDGWTHDPFAADVADGYIWGRGAVDMKDMVALEVGVLRLLAARARSAGRNPATDPIPGLGRDVLFASTADEEAGGLHGAGWLVNHRPETLRAAGALNECGGVATDILGRRLYPIGVAEKGYSVYRITIHGTWGHGSMPRDDNAAVRAATAIGRLAAPGTPRLTAPMHRFLAALAAELPDDTARLVLAIGDPDPSRSDAAIRRLCDPMYGRAARALLRDSISPDMVQAGIKYNVIPGEATVVIDCRTLPGTTEAAMRADVERRLGDLADVATIELIITADPVEASTETELYRLLETTVVAHDPGAGPVPVMMAFATDAKHTVKLGIPTYGFSPLRLEPEERFLERFHGVDERVGLDALRWGLPVLYDVVATYCASRDG